MHDASGDVGGREYGLQEHSHGAAPQSTIGWVRRQQQGIGRIDQ